MDYSTIFLIHGISVKIFFAIYFFKTLFLLLNKKKTLAQFTKIVKIPEMLVAFTFLFTGLYMVLTLPQVQQITYIKLGMVAISIPLAVIGFRRYNKILGLLSFLLLVGAYGLAEMGGSQKAKVPDMPSGNISELVRGQAIYSANCERCHGTTGDKGIAGAVNLSKSTLNYSETIDVVKAGKGSMPAFKMRAEDYQAVAKYVQELKKSE